MELETGPNNVNDLRILTVCNAIIIDFWDADKIKGRGEMTIEGVLNGRREEQKLSRSKASMELCYDEETVEEIASA